MGKEMNEEKFWGLKRHQFMVVKGYTNPEGTTSYIIQNRYETIYYETVKPLNLGEIIIRDTRYLKDFEITLPKAIRDKETYGEPDAQTVTQKEDPYKRHNDDNISRHQRFQARHRYNY